MFFGPLSAAGFRYHVDDGRFVVGNPNVGLLLGHVRSIGRFS